MKSLVNSCTNVSTNRGECFWRCGAFGVDTVWVLSSAFGNRL